MPLDEKSTVEQFIEEVKSQLRITSSDFAKATSDMTTWAQTINNVFGQGRARITELQTAVTDALPRINRLGGDIGEVGATIQGIAEASRRNVIANTKDVETLYAATKVVGGTSKDLVESFAKVGVGISQIGPELQKSVNYIQSIGGNTKQVMEDVRNNMDQMNRYQFDNGVQGLTKMAAQASMLRFDMSNTFALAEKVLSPEGAIETAAAFQRLGVAAGNLADPFQLMNQSINDPSGLQDSLANISKQFTYFDEKTKTFKINPQGVLTLKEMEKEAGLAQGSLSKMGLAAAELDKRISDVNKAGLKFASEEDKQYLANIAKMGETGKYEVELKDGTKKELASLNQDEFNEMIEAQKNQPKDLVDIARSQMRLDETLVGDVKAIKNALLGGIVSNREILNAQEAIRRGLTTATGAASNVLGSPEEGRKQVSQSIKDIQQFVKDFRNKDIKTTDAASEYLKKLGTQMQDVEGKLKTSMIKALEEAYSKTGNQTSLDRTLKAGYGELLEKVQGEKKEAVKPTSYSLIEGTKPQQIKQQVREYGQMSLGGGKSQVDFGGGIKVDINFNGGAADLTAAQKEQIVKMFVEKMNSTEMKNYIVSVNTTGNPTKAPVGARY